MIDLPIKDAKRTIQVKSKDPVTIERKNLPEVDWGNKIYEEFSQSHRIRKAVVKTVLTEWDAATNNDFIMFIECLREEFGVQVTSGKDNFHIVIPRKLIMGIPNPETYTRARRSLNSQGIGLPTNPRMAEMRSLREKAVREYFRNENEKRS